MRMSVLVSMAVVLLAADVRAQSYVVGTWPATATAPTPTQLLSSQTYPVSAVPCGLTPAPEDPPPLVNVNEGRIQDPANPLRDCAVNLTTQLRALPTGAYRVAGRTVIGASVGPWGPLSTAFAVSAAQVTHPCDGTPSSRATVTAGQVFVYGWCHDGKDTNGNAASVSGWKVFRNGTQLPGVTVTTDPLPNVQGLVFSSIARTEAAAGSVTLEVAATNSAGDSARGASMTFSVVLPATVPTAPTKGRVQ
jgi:hypothetical protein